MTIGADSVPVIFSALGVGIGLAWTIVSGNRAHARESLQGQIQAMQQLIKAKDQERDTLREEKLELEKANARLEVRLARLEAERGNGDSAHSA